LVCFEIGSGWNGHFLVNRVLRGYMSPGKWALLSRCHRCEPSPLSAAPGTHLLYIIPEAQS